MRHREKRRLHAFTLVELMVVLVLLGVLGAMAVPALSGSSAQTEVSGFAREIYAACNQARLAAISNRKQVRLSFIPQGSAPPIMQYRTALLPGPTPWSDMQWAAWYPNDTAEYTVNGHGGVQLVGVEVGRAVNAPPPATLLGAPVHVIFDVDGTVKVGGATTTTTTIYLADQTRLRPYRVFIYGRTGLARVLSQ